MKNMFKIFIVLFVTTVVISFFIYKTNKIKKDVKNQNVLAAEKINSLQIEVVNFGTQVSNLETQVSNLEKEMTYLLNSQNNSSFLSVDKIYLINLDRSKDRLAFMQKSLKDAKLSEYIRFSAVDGKKLRLIDKATKANINIPELRTKSNSLIGEFTVVCSETEPAATFDVSADFKTIPERLEGPYGNNCSHRLIWVDMLKKGYQKVLILEDDVTFAPNAKFKLSSILQQDLNYDIFALGNMGNSNFYNQEATNELVGKINAMPYVDSYIITNDAAKKLLQDNYLDSPIDWFISKFITTNKITAYAPRIPLAWQSLESIIGTHTSVIW